MALVQIESMLIVTNEFQNSNFSLNRNFQFFKEKTEERREREEREREENRKLNEKRRGESMSK